VKGAKARPKVGARSSARSAKPAKSSKAAPKSKSTKAAPKGKTPAKVVARKPALKPAKVVATAKAAPKPVVAKAAPAPVAKVAPVPVPIAKPALKAAPVKEPPKKPRKPEITPREIQNVKAMLEEQRAQFAREFSQIEDQTFNTSQSDAGGETSFDEEFADAGSLTFEREKDFSIGNNIRDLLDRVNHALGAIERGTYGLCENCGDPIAKARLLALPYSALCVRCKQLDERR